MSRIPCTCIDYPTDVLKWMLSKENAITPYLHKSPQIEKRGALIQFICMVCESLHLHITTTHLASYLLDCFMDAHHISDSQLHLAALTTVLLAAKFEEKDFLIPRICDLNVFASNKYSINLFFSMETFMLNFFCWHIAKATAAHFSEIYLVHALCKEDEESLQDSNSSHVAQELWLHDAEQNDSICSTPESGYASGTSLENSPVGH